MTAIGGVRPVISGAVVDVGVLALLSLIVVVRNSRSSGAGGVLTSLSLVVLVSTAVEGVLPVISGAVVDGGVLALLSLIVVVRNSRSSGAVVNSGILASLSLVVLVSTVSVVAMRYPGHSKSIIVGVLLVFIIL